MRTFVAATCAAFLALAPGAIATTREDIEERKRAHTEVKVAVVVLLISA